MDNDFTASLIPLSVIAVGIDWAGGWQVLNMFTTFLSQNGF